MEHQPSVAVRWGRRAWATLGVAGVVVGIVFLASQVSLILTPVVLALFPAALANPLAARLRRSRLPNALGALLLLLLLVLVFVIPVYFIVPALAAQAPQLASSVVDGLAQLDRAVDWSRLPGNIKGASDLARQAIGALGGGGGGGALTGGLGLVRRVGDVGTGAVLLLVILFFYFKDGRRMWAGVLGLLPARLQPETDLLAQESFWTIGAFLRGQLLVALVDAVFIGLGLWILGVPLVLPLAVLVFFGGLFPIVGAFLSGTVAVVVALASRGLGTALLTLGVVLLVQQLEGHVLSPIIQARNIALHPLVIILAVTTGGAIMGILGAFLGVPVAAVIARIVDHLQGREPAAGPAGLRRRAGPAPPLDPGPAADPDTEATVPGDGRNQG
ncbi:AI-2E family transporter [Georgenia ruanii]|uniref:AI-2E family transporter n=1 Tax=Georgenia ruanii TaxID=348442 RepID=A0A7J9UT99_9MICO|nr:AI-2E family transporter [Georgenia ruanii]MPV87100.1 AI-2E family transporter [Georgenia ruanii]